MSQPNVWIIDHRDSFTWNLAELVRTTGMAVPLVMAADDSRLEQAVTGKAPLILSPGPGTVHDACHRPTFRLLDKLPPNVPVLGVCLGHQILGVHAGAELEQLTEPRHGCRATMYKREPSPLLEGLPGAFQAGLYHSWRLAHTPWPDELAVAAVDAEGHIMSIRHRRLPRFGIQFHPESILTPEGGLIMRNFLHMARKRNAC